MLRILELRSIMARVAQIAKRFSGATSLLLAASYNADVVGGEGVGDAALSLRRWATKKAGGSTQNGLKKYGGQTAPMYRVPSWVQVTTEAKSEGEETC